MTVRNAQGEPFSKWKPAQKFAHIWDTDGISGPLVREYEFDADRKWRFDFAWPPIKLAVEIDGFGFGHQAPNRIEDNHMKQNAAVLQGWRVFRFTSAGLGSLQKIKDAVAVVVEAMVLPAAPK